MRGREYGVPFQQTATGSSSATATQNQPSSTTNLYVTDVSGSSDLAGATLQIKDGSTVIWQERIGNTAPYQHTFDQPLIAKGTLTVVVTGTSLSNANVAGYSL